MGHFVARVHRVQRVQKVQRVVVSPFGRRLKKRGAVDAAGCVEGLCSLRSGGNGPSGRGLWYRPLGDEYKVSVTGFTFSIIRYDKHSADWLAALASPYPASPDFPLCRGQNKTPRNILFISTKHP